MARKETEFAKYATAFYKIIEGGKGGKAKFVKMLLNMGLSANGKTITDELFPTETTSKGNTIIKKEASDRLRKYLRGENDISDIADEIYAALDKELYCEELKEYEESRIIEFAKSLQLDTDFENIEEVRKDIAAYYRSIIEKASSKTSGKTQETNVNPTSNRQSIILSYTITEDEKKAIINLCNAIKRKLERLDSQVNYIYSNQSELDKITESYNNLLKGHIEYRIELKAKEFNETYSEFVSLCADLNSILAPKKNMNKNFAELISITSFFSKDENKEMSIDRFTGTHVQVKVYDLRTYIKYSLREVDMQ
ncbi:MAG: hypothetical protein K6G20_10425 [Ruminococcus sp.]|nr:hypothetical protein [Ruminococcus sp.]